MTDKYVYHVRHVPSGEDWVALLIKDGKVYAAGWPPSIGALSDCINIYAIRERTPEENKHLQTEFGVYIDSLNNTTNEDAVRCEK